MLAWLSVCSKVQTCIWPSWCHCHSLSLASVKSRLVLPFWYRLTWVVPETGECVCVCLIAYSICNISAENYHSVQVSGTEHATDKVTPCLYCYSPGTLSGILSGTQRAVQIVYSKRIVCVILAYSTLWVLNNNVPHKSTPSLTHSLSNFLHLQHFFIYPQHPFCLVVESDGLFLQYHLNFLSNKRPFNGLFSRTTR